MALFEDEKTSRHPATGQPFAVAATQADREQS